MHQPHSSLGPVLRAWRDQRYVLILSETILAELRHVLATPYFRRYLSDADRGEAVRVLLRDATITPISVEVQGVATHPEDDLILATAVSGNADYLVTLDRQLLTIGAYQGVKIVSPQTFLAVLAAEA